MRHALILALAASLAALPGAIPAQAQQADTAWRDALERASRALARVRATGCADDDSRGGTGFVWQQPDRMVTALHVVADCSQVLVQFHGSAERPIRRVRNVLREADLVLLEIDPNPRAAPLQHSTRVPEPTEVLRVYGYPLMIATPEDAPLTIKDSNRFAFRLGQAIDQRTAQLLQGGVPSLAIEVLRTDGNLQQGHSGAPLIDRDGRVVGIGSGGVNAGVTGIGWSVRARYLESLPQATDRPTMGDAAGSRARFAASLGPPGGTAAAPGRIARRDFQPPRRLRCGGVDFVQSRIRTLGELAETSDDQRGLHQMMQWMSMPLSELRDMYFAVWSDPRSGAGIALPFDADPRVEDNLCVADLAGTRLSIWFGGQRVQPGLPDDADWRDRQFAVWDGFQGAVLRFFGQVRPERVDQRSYGREQVRGPLMVYRGLDADRQVQFNVTKTLMSDRDTFIGVMLADWRGETMQRPELDRLVAASRLAVHLATFPPDR
jgi:hypothetical protein